MKRVFIFLCISVSLILGCSKTEYPPGRRYIVTSPEIAEIISLLGGSGDIVGVTVECDHPSELQKIVKVGNFGKVNFEQIISLEPTMVFTSGLEQELLTSELNKLQIPTAQFYPRSIDDMFSSIREIGIITGLEKRADFVADSLQKEINLIFNNKSKDAPRVYVEIYNEPIMSVSDSSFVGQVIQLAGGNNIFSKLPRDYSRVKAEDIINNDPEVIILTYPYEYSTESVKSRKGWEVISAVQNDRIYNIHDINPDHIIRATPRVISGIKKLKQLFHDKK